MLLNQKLKDNNGYEVALFPLESFIVTQRDDETYSHEPLKYLATDYQGFHYNSGSDSVIGTGYVLSFCPYYAPVSMICSGIDKTNSSICWRSINKVHLANGTIDYLIILFYHDNNIVLDKYSVNDRISQGEIIGYTGTAGDAGAEVANHVHIETGFGQNWDKVYEEPDFGHINLDYALHNYDALFGNDSICYGIYAYPDKYPWIYFEEPFQEQKTRKFPWQIYATKLLKKRNLTF